MKYKYHIYQLDKDNENVRKYRKMFVSWDFLEKYCGGFNIREYNKIYDGEIESAFKRDEVVLDILFRQFNLNHPIDFHGHSLSVSDVVVLNGTMYYCDSLCWKKI